MVSNHSWNERELKTSESKKEIEKQENALAIRTVVEEDMLLKVLKTYEGRRVLFNIIAKGDIYDQEGQMPYELAQSQRCIGRREVAVETLKDCLTVYPDVYILMQQEAGDFDKKFNLKNVKDNKEEYDVD